MSVPMIVDTDTASDDAVALIMALRAPEVDVKAITVVAGNVSLAQGSRNARYTVELCGSAAPVYEGADRPLLREASPASWFHGEDGLGDRRCPLQGASLPRPGLTCYTGGGRRPAFRSSRARRAASAFTIQGLRAK